MDEGLRRRLGKWMEAWGGGMEDGKVDSGLGGYGGGWKVGEMVTRLGEAGRGLTGGQKHWGLGILR